MKFCGALLLLASMAVHAQVYKCPDASGRLSLQQTPCVGGSKLDVRPASGRDPLPVPTGLSDGAAATAGSAPAKKSFTDQLAEEREQRERWARLNNAKLQVDGERATCDREQTALAARKRSSNNNLAGATRDVSISHEMEAAATLCAGRLRSLEGEVIRAQAECDRLGCRRPGS